MGNRTFFKNVSENKMSFKEIFSEVRRKHTPEETASVFIAGTAFTTPKEEEMLSGWQKPFLFARFFAIWLICLLIVAGLLLLYPDQLIGYSFLIVGIPCLVPITLLLLVWEMNIPRDIPLYEVFMMVGVGGALSIVAAIVGFMNTPEMDAMWAGLVEEPAKLLAIYYFLKKKDRKYVLDGALIGVAVGTGFAVFESQMYAISGLLSGGAPYGVMIAILRAITAIGGHGFFAGLYGAGLMMAKGNNPIALKHLTSPKFLKYFGLSIAFHAYHNMGIEWGLPVFLNGLLRTEYIIEAIVAFCVLMYVLKMGVNEVVTVCTEKNEGRVSVAVNRELNFQINGKVAEERKRAVTLEGISGPYMGKVYKIMEGQMLTVGRASGRNGIELPACSSVSSVHCQIAVKEGKVGIKDLNSTNGTYIGERKLIPQKESFAGDGMILYLGDKQCGFRIRVE